MEVRSGVCVAKDGLVEAQNDMKKKPIHFVTQNNTKNALKSC